MLIRIAPETPHNFTVEAEPIALKELAAKVPGASSSRHGLLFVPINPAATHELLLATKAREFSPDALKVALDIEQVTKAFQRAQAEAGPFSGETSRKLMPHQEQAAFAIFLRQYSGLLADDMGLGKSLVALECYSKSKIQTCTIFCPAFLKRNWWNEIELAFRNEADPSVPEVIIIEGTPAKRADAFALAPRTKFLILNYDILPFLTEEQLHRLRARTEKGFCIWDESHYLKNRKAKRTQLAHHLRGRVNLLLTGTPIRNDSSDLFSQLTLIEPRLWRSYWEFEGRYLQMGEMNVGHRRVRKIVGSKNREELQRIVNCYQIRRKKSEVLDLPPKITTVCELDLDPASHSLYEAMRTWWTYTFADIPDDELIFTPKARTALEALLRLEQICQGFVGGVPEALNQHIAKMAGSSALQAVRPGEWIFPKSTKVEWLLEQIENLNRPVVVWFRFNAPLLYFKDLLGDKAVALHGALSDKEKGEAIDAFQNDYGPKVFLGQVTMGTGFNLVRAQDQIFYGRDWSPFVNFQAADRLHRIGQRGTVNIYIPVIRMSFEWRLHERLEGKRSEAEVVLGRTTFGELREMLNG